MGIIFGFLFTLCFIHFVRINALKSVVIFFSSVELNRRLFGIVCIVCIVLISLIILIILVLLIVILLLLFPGRLQILWLIIERHFKGLFLITARALSHNFYFECLAGGVIGYALQECFLGINRNSVKFDDDITLLKACLVTGGIL